MQLFSGRGPVQSAIDHDSSDLFLYGENYNRHVLASVLTGSAVFAFASIFAPMEWPVATSAT